MILPLLLIASLISVTGCTGTISHNKAAVVQKRRANLNQQYTGFTKDTFKSVYGEPRRTFKRKTLYYVKPDCSHWGCPREEADEMWSYLIGEVFATGQKYYSVYIYFKDDRVVHIR